jgi:hypothetical protein
MPNLFISHASADRPFALQLSHSLTQLGHLVWIDVQGIDVGDALVQQIGQAVEMADYLIVVLSKQSAASAWSAHEWQAKYYQEIVSQQTCVLPVLLEECAIPLFLRPKRYADFRADYAVGLAQLAVALRTPSSPTLPGRCDEQGSSSLQKSGHQIATQDIVSEITPFCYDLATMYKGGQLIEVNVGLDIPYVGKIEGIWKPDEREQDAAWALYVELVTRIAVAELGPTDGLLRESLSSLYGIFTTTREILRTYGPAVARPKGDSKLSFGSLAISVLNFALRPVLAKWHPLLLDYEHQREASVSQLKHEQAWEKAEELRQDLNRVRHVLIQYAEILAQISKVPAVIPERAHALDVA